MNLPRLIGITGLAGAGKDTLADYLVSTFGYSKYSLASPLKKLLSERFGWDDDWWNDRAWKEEPRNEYGGQGYVGSWGNNAYKPFSPRSWAQWLGTEVGRYIGGEDVWVNMMAREWKHQTFLSDTRTGYQPRMVVSDIRFDNEARRIHELGGVVIRIVRPGLAAASHASEQGVNDRLVNVQVFNTDDIDHLITESIHALEACPQDYRYSASDVAG
jgi:hypothetical protein